MPSLDFYVALIITILLDPISYIRFLASRLNFYVFTGAAALGTCILLRSVKGSLASENSCIVPSPRETILPKLSDGEARQLPYPPDALPGARDIDSPYGSIRVYEWGPENGQRILLIHGISTPSIALADLGHKLADRGCRVMLFDLFGRGYSSGPSPTTHHYDSALYAFQIFLCLQSSPVLWDCFVLIGYSLGGAIAADFTSYFPHLVEGLVLVASGGLIRTKHITWKSRLLYSTSGIVPEWVIERLVAKRLWTGPETARSIEPEPDTTMTPINDEEPKGGLRSHAVYTSSHLGLLAGRPQSTASKVVDWQIQHHRGFVSAFISSIRFAPIHNQHHRWRIIGQNIEKGVGKLKEVRMVLGETDPIIVAEELIKDATHALGEGNLKVVVVKGAGHEVAIDRADEIADVLKDLFR